MIDEELPTYSHAPYRTIAVPIHNCANSRTIAKSPKKQIINTATEPSTATVTEIDVLVVMGAADSLHLSPDTAAV